MVVMLRTLGIPARLAVGFAVPQNIDNVEGVYHVFGNNAYAWPEVYFPGLGWIPFSPSRAYNPYGAPASPEDTWSGDPLDTISTQELLDMFPNAVPGATTTPEAAAAASPAENAAGGTLLPWLMVPLLLVVGLSLASAAGLRFAWNRGLERPEPSGAGPGEDAPARVVGGRRAAPLADSSRVPARPARDSARRARSAGALRRLRARRVRATDPLRDEDEAKLDALWKRLRPRLLRRILRRDSWSGEHGTKSWEAANEIHSSSRQTSAG